MAESVYPRLQKAIKFATRCHKGQDREGDSPLPYITHPIEVLMNLRYIGGETDEDLLCAAALHDVVEESQVAFQEISDRCGPNVALLVKELTRREPSPEETAGLTKEQVTLLRGNMLLEEISMMSVPAQRVKLADRLSNVKEAFRSKSGAKLDAYMLHSRRVLETIPKDVSPPLWEAIAELLPKAK